MVSAVNHRHDDPSCPTPDAGNAAVPEDGAPANAMSFLVRAKPITLPPQFKVDTPIPFVIPYDLWVALFAWLDFATLQSFSLVCRDFKHEVDKYIWRACTLRAPSRPHEFWTRKHLEEGCHILLRDRRASRLRELAIDIEASLGVEDDPEFTRILALIMEVLQNSRKLRSLRVKSVLHRAHIAFALSAPFVQQHASSSGNNGYPFRLERFATDLFCDHNLYGFWSSQSASLKHVELLTLPGDARHPPSLPCPLPALTTVHTTVAHQTAILRSSPVRTVDLAIWEGECSIVKENICAVAPATIDLLFSETFVALPKSALDASASCSCSTTRKRDESPLRLSSSFPAGAGGNTFRRGDHPRGTSASPSSPFSSRTRRRHTLRRASDEEMELGPGILDLRLMLFDSFITSQAYTNIVTHLPHLRVLRLTHGDMPSRAHRLEALEVLAGLQDLEVFEWAGGSPAAQADVFAVASKQCKNLREIVFRWGNGNYFERRFERESEEAGWGIVQS